MSTETQQLMARTLQQFLTEQYPSLDWSVGTVLYDLLVKPASVAFAEQSDVATVIRENLSLSLVLAQDNPNADLVDALLSNYNVVRKTGNTATGTILIYTDATQNVFIPVGALFTCNEIQLQPVKSYVGVYGAITEENTDEISYVQLRDVGDGTRVFAITAETVEVMTSALSSGLACTASLGNTRITKIETGSSFTGGSIEETTDELLERAQSGVNATVVTGRDNIRELLRRQDTVNVLDAAVFGMGDTLQYRDSMNNAGISTGGRLDVYVKTAPIPVVAEATLPGTKLDGVWSIEIPADSYPGAAGVSKIRYGNLLIDTGITHVLSYNPQGPWPLIESALHARYSKYQTLTVQFENDNIDSLLTELDFVVSVIYMPGIGVLQDYMNGAGIRSHAFDHVIKGAIPILIEADVDIEYVRGTPTPTVGAIQQEIADVINRKLISTEALYTSDIVYACRYVFSEGVVRMPINLRGRLFMPDGSFVYTSSQNHIKSPTAAGISFENTVFGCFPADVNVVLNEVLT
jgi:hypothetical protein